VSSYVRRPRRSRRRSCAGSKKLLAPKGASRDRAPGAPGAARPRPVRAVLARPRPVMGRGAGTLAVRVPRSRPPRVPWAHQPRRRPRLRARRPRWRALRWTAVPCPATVPNPRVPRRLRRLRPLRPGARRRGPFRRHQGRSVPIRLARAGRLRRRRRKAAPAAARRAQRRPGPPCPRFRKVAAVAASQVDSPVVSREARTAGHGRAAARARPSLQRPSLP